MKGMDENGTWGRISILTRWRFWAIRVLAGNSTVVLNADIGTNGAHLSTRGQDVLLCGNVINTAGWVYTADKPEVVQS